MPLNCFNGGLPQPPPKMRGSRRIKVPLQTMRSDIIRHPRVTTQLSKHSLGPLKVGPTIRVEMWPLRATKRAKTSKKSATLHPSATSMWTAFVAIQTKTATNTFSSTLARRPRPRRRIPQIFCIFFKYQTILKFFLDSLEILGNFFTLFLKFDKVRRMALKWLHFFKNFSKCFGICGLFWLGES